MPLTGTAEGAAAGDATMADAAAKGTAMFGLGACAEECGSSDGWAVGTFELKDNELGKDALQKKITSVTSADPRLESLKGILKKDPAPAGGGKRRRTRKSNKKKKIKKK